MRLETDRQRERERQATIMYIFSIDVPYPVHSKRHAAPDSDEDFDRFLQAPHEWVHHSSTGSKHKFSVNNLGQSDQVFHPAPSKTCKA